MNRHLTHGGKYIIGLHVLTGHKPGKRIHRWQGVRGRLNVATSITVVRVSRRREILRYSLRVRKPAGTEHYSSTYALRTYTLHQFEKLIKLSACFEILAAYDVSSGYTGPVNDVTSCENLAFVLGKI